MMPTGTPSHDSIPDNLIRRFGPEEDDGNPRRLGILKRMYAKLRKDDIPEGVHDGWDLGKDEQERLAHIHSNLDRPNRMYGLLRPDDVDYHLHREDGEIHPFDNLYSDWRLEAA